MQTCDTLVLVENLPPSFENCSHDGNFRCRLNWLKTQIADKLSLLCISVKILLEGPGV